MSRPGDFKKNAEWRVVVLVAKSLAEWTATRSTVKRASQRRSRISSLRWNSRQRAGIRECWNTKRFTAESKWMKGKNQTWPNSTTNLASSSVSRHSLRVSRLQQGS